MAVDQPSETAEQVLAKYLMTDEEGRALYAAYRVLPNGASEAVSKVVKTAPSPSLVALHKLAHDMREAEPTLSRDQAFAKVTATRATVNLSGKSATRTGHPAPTHQ